MTFRILATIALLGFITAVFCGLLTWIKPPIFDEITFAWISFGGLLAAAIATAALILPSIWEL